MFVSDCDVTDGRYNSRQTRGVLNKIRAALLSIVWTNDVTF
jgi:hypothetical protein